VLTVNQNTFVKVSIVLILLARELIALEEFGKERVLYKKGMTHEIIMAKYRQNFTYNYKLRVSFIVFHVPK
jgi:hypothetical protein